MKCYICKGELKLVGSRPFSDNIPGLSVVDRTEVQHYRCTGCNFLCIPSMLSWSQQEFSKKVYNSEYSLVDTGYGSVRAMEWIKVWPDIVNVYKRKSIRHLDYGSGEGHLSKLLVHNKWDSHHYDPYSSPTPPEGKFNLITAIEVFEHSTNIFNTVKDIKRMLTKEGCIVFSTKFSTGKEGMDWWYLNPRGGHIGILSEKSMKIVAKECGLFFSSITDSIHILQRFRENSKQILLGA